MTFSQSQGVITDLLIHDPHTHVLTCSFEFLSGQFWREKWFWFQYTYRTHLFWIAKSSGLVWVDGVGYLHFGSSANFYGSQRCPVCHYLELPTYYPRGCIPSWFQLNLCSSCNFYGSQVLRVPLPGHTMLYYATHTMVYYECLGTLSPDRILVHPGQHWNEIWFKDGPK